jgi:hypothetical protein
MRRVYPSTSALRIAASLRLKPSSAMVAPLLGFKNNCNESKQRDGDQQKDLVFIRDELQLQIKMDKSFRLLIIINIQWRMKGQVQMKKVGFFLIVEWML